MQTLAQEISTEIPEEYINYKTMRNIENNLNSKFQLRPYQRDAFYRFTYYLSQFKNRIKPSQLLFHMATGSGKTLIMAGAIIHLYEKGYRNFLFFVDNTNIIEKTKDNFFNVNSSKYLFSNRIQLGDKIVKIKEADNFQSTNNQDINIVFSTIQGLHSRMNTPKENNITFEDFVDTKVVLISDEAHHINAETKNKNRLAKSESENLLSWEGTVNRIFNANKENLLLEFTATIDLSNKEIRKKYEDKIIFNYPLKQFRLDGYSKEVKVLQADLPPFERAIQAVLLSQFRRKIFEKKGISTKPVVLFKSKKIDDSRRFLVEFSKRIKTLNVSDIQKIKDANQKGVLKHIFNYLEDNQISLENFVDELKEDFSEEKLISVDSKDESEAKQLAINSLEDENNYYRAIFAVDKLNEGWDVLNLFDIVRLYDTKDSRKGNPGKTTISEAQLIGRGARYYPFQISKEQPRYKRKYDEFLDHELRICEELYYHSFQNPEYIKELNTALVSIGMKEAQTEQVPFKLKASFKKSSLFKTGDIFLNERHKNLKPSNTSLPQSLLLKEFTFYLKTGTSSTSNAFSKAPSTLSKLEEKEFKLVELGLSILFKAIRKLPFYRFSNLKQHFLNLKSVSEFITSEAYLGSVKLTITGLPEQLDNLSANQKLEAVLKVLDDISTVLAKEKTEYIGSNVFKPFRLKDKVYDKTLNLRPENSKKSKEFEVLQDLYNQDWYPFESFFGTTEEEQFLESFGLVYNELKSQFEEIYLIPNKRYVRVYSFENGKAIEPSFVLFLKQKKDDKNRYYQVFLHSKKLEKKFLKQLYIDHSLNSSNKDEYVLSSLSFTSSTPLKDQLASVVNLE
ncbi:MAG TPA: DEAD/DEAH box helicase family protein [Aequorivita sp.]|nr:DEAD/DEAH box helicase family protein [Aequorivita sp.]